MSNLTALVTIFCSSSAAPTYTVLEVRTTQSFAGRLGHLVHRTVVLKSETGKKTVSLNDFHDAILPTPKKIRVGEVVHIRDGEAIEVIS